MKTFKTQIRTQNILILVIIFINLFFMSIALNAQDFVNGDLEGPIMGSTAPGSWLIIPMTDVNCQATWAGGSTPDITGLGQSLAPGVQGVPFSGTTFVSGLHSGNTGSNRFQEGIMQQVSGFIVGETYKLNFYQANVKQQTAYDPSGGWAVYMNGILEYNSPSSFNYNSEFDVNLDWDYRSYEFTANSNTINFQFLPIDDDTDLSWPHGVRMGIDSVYIVRSNTQLRLSLDSNDVICYGESTGSVQSNLTGGVAPYTYSWNNGYTTPDITGLAAGTYSLTVTDDNGSMASQTIQVNQSPALNVSASVNNVLCYGATTGSIQLNVSGGTPTYSYAWDKGTFSQLITGLSAGTYIYTVTDKLGCKSSDTINLLESPEMVIMLNSTDVLCNGGNNGAISTTIAGDTSPYTYSWNNGSSDADINILSAGMYVLTVVDDNGCEAVDSIEIKEPAVLDLVLSSTDVSCYGEATASIQSNISGGTSPYTYSWDNGYSTSDISGLTSGSYALTVTDDNGCVTSKTIQVNQSPELIVSADVNDVLCYGASSGSIQLNVSGGTPNYTYEWDNGSTSSLINGLNGGAYIYTVTDKLGCESSDTINLLESSDMSITFSATDVLCYGGNNGAISTTIAGGTSPYTYSWNNGSSDADINTLGAGMYVLTVVDDYGCEEVDSIEITEPSEMIVLLDSTNVLCNGGATGSVQTNVTGGTSPYIYSWDNGYATSDISGLMSGSYTLTVTDNNGCQFINTVFVDEPNEMILDLDTVNVLCYGYSTGSVQSNVSGGTSPYTYSWNNGYSTSNINSLSIGSYTLTVTDENGCSSVAVAEVTQTNEIIIDATIDSVLCENEDIGSIDINVSGGTGPYEYIWSNNQLTQDIGNLSPGVYDLTVKDLNNCMKSESFTISNPPPFNIQLSQDTFVCEGEDVVLNASGGSTYEWSNGSASSSIEILASQSSTYIVTVTSGLGCVAKDSTTVNIWNNPDAYAGEDTTIYVGMSTTLSGSGGVSYSWTPEDFLDCPSCPDPISTPDNDMEYILWVTDANGCVSSDTVWVFIDSKTNLFVPNAFSPNMDGFNDEFKVYGNNIEDLQLVVYDRWGEMVFQANDQDSAWDGTYKGKELNNATFVYILKVRTAEGDDIVKKGDINLLK